MKSPSNFEGLVLGCMDSYDSNQIVILQHFSRSTRFSYFCTAQISKFQRKPVQIFAGMKIFNPSVPKDEVVMLVVDLPQRVSKSFLIAFFAKFKLFDMMRYTIVR